MILGDVEETVTTVVIDDETYEEIYKVCLLNNTHLVLTKSSQLLNPVIINFLFNLVSIKIIIKYELTAYH